ncbi:hypothetical protein PIB30_049419 [Stylosanthes scabra]|uniref:Transmembrane protein n=1 Tax=Stylosanthes scabra TaxID=79078 RepID=A0ABU6RI12_9FABA|nr:hypothetical protein [Stylosanthes scabra]
MGAKVTLIQSPFSFCPPHFHSRRCQPYLLLLLSALTPPFNVHTPYIFRVPRAPPPFMEREDHRGFKSFKRKNHCRLLCFSGSALLRRPARILTPKVLPLQLRIPPPSPHRDPVEPASSSFSHDLRRRRRFVFFIFLPLLSLLLVSLFGGCCGCCDW